MRMRKADLIAFESEVATAFNQGRIRAPVHLAGGNEDELIEIFEKEKIGPKDWVLSTWRSHFHCLLKGVPPSLLMADILAGNSITLCYPRHRILTSAIVGGILPIAVGLAWAIKRAGEKERVFAFVGDMGAETGVFSECTRYAAGHELPIRFVVESNGLSVQTPTETVWGAIPPATFPEASEIALDYVDLYGYKLGWPHAGAGVRVNF